MPEVKFIAAIDDKRGIAKRQKIPWKLPIDVKYFKDKVATGPVVMGYKTYASNGHRPFSKFENVVFTHNKVAVYNVAVEHDLPSYFKNLDHDVWVAGGGEIFGAALPYATKLYITRVSGDYNCDVFFPEFENNFELTEKSDDRQENGITYRFEIWRPKIK